MRRRGSFIEVLRNLNGGRNVQRVANNDHLLREYEGFPFMERLPYGATLAKQHASGVESYWFRAA